VHDELIFDVPDGEVSRAKKLIEETMCGAMQLPNGVPIEAGTGIGQNWLEAH
jgi:DNA polymerase-1